MSSPLLEPEECTATVDGRTVELSTEQAENAALIAGVSVRRGMPARAASIALATAYQESKLYNLESGDRDSLGLFQQRPSQGWGSRQQILNPYLATTAFYDALQRVDGYETMRVTEAAQEVQRSGFPEAYADHEADARVLASALTGQSFHAFSCSVDDDADAASSEADEGRAHPARRRRTPRGRGGLRRPGARRVRRRRGPGRPHGGLRALRRPRDRHLRAPDQRAEQGAGLGDRAVPRRPGRPAGRPDRDLRRPDLEGRLPVRRRLDGLRPAPVAPATGPSSSTATTSTSTCSPDPPEECPGAPER